MIPRIGHLRLQRLTVEHLDEMYRDLEARGGRRGQPLSPTTVRHCHNILHKALDDAVRRSLVVRNVADWADPPPLERRQMEIWTADQLRRFLHHVRDDSLYALWLLACTTGMRRGELVGLRWQWVDLDRGRLTIATQTTVVDGHPHEEDPKSARGRRTIALDPTTVAALRAHRKRQAEERLAAGPAWQETGRVFVWPDGRAINPKRVLGWLRRHAAELELPPVRVHDLRHAWATAALEASVELKVVSTRLGHARTAITADIYQHVTDRLDQQAAVTVAASILGRSLSDAVSDDRSEPQNNA
jgi:integrase